MSVPLRSARPAGTYTPGVISALPTCSVTGSAGSGYEANAKWYHGLTN